MPKILASKNGSALAAFSGDSHFGEHAIRQAASINDPLAAIAVLTSASAEADVEFAYAHFDQSGPTLLRISNGKISGVNVLHLGIHDAFEKLQAIRLEESNPYAPLALKIFMAGARFDVPSRLSETIRCMTDLFASRPEHDVGGWAVPYLLTKGGACFCGYCYGVSDPLFDKLMPGSIIPHGTAPAGGSTLSVTEVGNAEGMAVYWLQNTSGRILIDKNGQYETIVLHGRPTLFKQLARLALGKEIDLWIGDKEPGQIKSLTVMRGKDGHINSVIADHGDSLSFVVHNMATPFVSGATISMTNTDELKKIKPSVNDDKSAISLGFPQSQATQLELSAAEVDDLIFSLGQARSELGNPVPPNFPEHATLAVQIDPRWYTTRSPHPSISGILLRLRHSGLVWLGFLLPTYEARSLGKWLVDNSPEQADQSGPHE